MKSYSNLFEKLIATENLHKAIINASKNKTHRKDVIEILNNPWPTIKEIQGLLINKTYKIQMHQAELVHDGKPRVVIKPHFKSEHILHWAVIQVISDIILKGMYQFSCGSIPGRGPHYIKRYIEKFIKNNKRDCKYVLKMDIHHFFQSIDTHILKQKFRRIIKDDKMMWVLEMIIDSNKAMYNGELIDGGLPIGFYTSQWFANFFLQDLDHYIKEELHMKCFVRYVDDIAIFCRNKKELHKALEHIKCYLNNINLTIKSNYQVSRFDYVALDGTTKGRPLDFIGFKFYRDKTTLRRKTLNKAIRKARAMYKKKNYTWYDACQLLSYLGWFKHTNTHKIFCDIILLYVSIKHCKELIRNKEKVNASKVQNK